MEDLKNMVLSYRKKYKISQVDFAKKCEVCYLSILNIEKGRCNYTKKTYDKIMKVLNED